LDLTLWVGGAPQEKTTEASVDHLSTPWAGDVKGLDNDPKDGVHSQRRRVLRDAEATGHAVDGLRLE
jgi:hypothetical protein